MNDELVRGIYTNNRKLIYAYEPGDCWMLVAGVGMVVRQSDGRTILFGQGTPGHPCDLPDITPEWRAACA